MGESLLVGLGAAVSDRGVDDAHGHSGVSGRLSTPPHRRRLKEWFFLAEVVAVALGYFWSF